jgi:glutaredoxin-like protein NrdH
MPDKKIMVYALSTCSHCKSAKKLLTECSAKYDCIDVDLLSGDEKKRVVDEMRKYNPDMSFPTIIIDGKVIVGYRESDLKEALGIK